MNIKFEKGRIEDIDKLAELYDNLNDYLSANINYPGWIKGIYPTRQHAVEGVEGRNFVYGKNIRNNCGFDYSKPQA